MKSDWNQLWSHIEENFQSELIQLQSSFLDRCVLSASGLRFIHSGDEEDLSPEPHVDALAFAVVVLDVYLKRIKRITEEPKVWLGMDARPTGPCFFLLAYQFLRANGVKVNLMGHGPIPEVMAATHQGGATGFCYFTASHNPAGHNGFKLGLADGAVLNRNEAQALIETIKEYYHNECSLSREWERFLSIGFEEENLITELQANKRISMEAYQSFAFKTIGVRDSEAWGKEISASWDKKPLFLMDMNGSSRLKSIDLNLLEKLGLECIVMNDQLGEFAHAIVPEGESLLPLKVLMQKKCDEGYFVLGGMVPDCDGDRGNLILPINGQATALKAQETFALCALAELSTAAVKKNTPPLALAVNGPSSLRLEELLKPFKVEIARAEVGEANVLAMAKAMKAKGYAVPISGEGSNGGNILDGGTVRDPLMTLLSLLKFSQAKTESGKTAADHCIEKSKLQFPDQVSPWEKSFALLPNWNTTDAFEGDALMPVPKVEHEVLKTQYEKLLGEHFEGQPQFWKSKGIASLKFVNNEGIQNIRGPGGRPAPGKGGLQVFLCDEHEHAIGFLWMRGSGTEPVFRVVVDWKGPEDQYKLLLELQRDLMARSAILVE